MKSKDQRQINDVYLKVKATNQTESGWDQEGGFSARAYAFARLLLITEIITDYLKMTL